MRLLFVVETDREAIRFEVSVLNILVRHKRDVLNMQGPNGAFPLSVQEPGPKSDRDL